MKSMIAFFSERGLGHFLRANLCKAICQIRSSFSLFGSIIHKVELKIIQNNKIYKQFIEI